MIGYPLELLSVSPEIVGRAQFFENHSAFDGHFPGNPILPAFMQIQVAMDLLDMARERMGGSVQAESRFVIASSKFARPVKPGEAIDVKLLQLHPGKFEATLMVKDELCSRFVFGTTPLPRTAT